MVCRQEQPLLSHFQKIIRRWWSEGMTGIDVNSRLQQVSRLLSKTLGAGFIIISLSSRVYITTLWTHAIPARQKP